MEKKQPKRKYVKKTDKFVGKVQKGEIRNPNGRKKGSENKITTDIKEAFKLLIENNLSNLDKWIAEIAKTDPKGAINLLIQLGPYVIPKLSSQDVKFEEVKEPIDYSKLTEEELIQLEELMNKTKK